jgi:NAD(P)H-hydrate epimerase
MGAPGIAALASMRAGAGYLTVCVPASQTALIDSHSLEVMTRALPERDGELAAESVSVVKDALKQGSALALGPGLGRAPASIAFARDLAASAGCPLVLDADGLNAHEGALDELSARTSPTVLTPHAGELGRLLEISSADVQRERLRHVRAAAERSGAVVVLKGDDTLIAEPTGRVAVSAGASPALATAGTGDALTGVICALLAQGLDTFTAACAGVWLHAQAGRVAAHRQGSAASVIATDVIAALGAARDEGHST